MSRSKRVKKLGVAKNIYTVKYHPKTSNLAHTCDEIAKRGISYAYWQKEQYKADYDVKTGMSEKIANLKRGKRL